MKIFKTKHVLSHPDTGSNPSDQPFWHEVYDSMRDGKHTHIKDGNNVLYAIDNHNKLSYADRR